MSPAVLSENSDSAANLPDAPPYVDAVETGDEGNHLPEQSAGNEGEEVEVKDGRVRPDPTVDPVTEFSCGLERGELGGTSVCSRGGGGPSELHQYDGIEEEEEEEAETREGQNGLDCFLKPKVPAVTVMDRLTELHGSETLSFSSALAAQVAARSHSLISMEEQTFGDDEEDGEEEECNSEKDETLIPAALTNH